jgi:hypoxanthine phosphoribosyltransferase
LKKELITYTEYGHILSELVTMIQDSRYFLEDIKLIYTFMRGGAPIAVHLAHFLELDVATDESNHILPLNKRTTLIVDDIADTGKTLKGYQDFTTATLFYKPRSIVKPTFYVRETTNWIVFPWEKVDEIPNR